MTIVSKLEGIENIAVPAGTFECVRIRRTVQKGGAGFIHWYARNVGLVKMEAQKPAAQRVPAGTVVLELKSYGY